jgi:hypothetical protein
VCCVCAAIAPAVAILAAAIAPAVAILAAAALVAVNRRMNVKCPSAWMTDGTTSGDASFNIPSSFNLHLSLFAAASWLLRFASPFPALNTSSPRTAINVRQSTSSYSDSCFFFSFFFLFWLRNLCFFGGFLFLLSLVGFGVSFFADADTPFSLLSKVGAIICWSLN